jgi:hypothetical protein
MKRIRLLSAVLFSLLLLSGCGKNNKRPDGSQFEGDIRDKSSGWKNQK